MEESGEDFKRFFDHEGTGIRADQPHSCCLHDRVTDLGGLAAAPEFWAERPVNNITLIRYGM